MKYLKLLLIIGVVVGLFYAAISLTDNDTTDGSGTGIDPESATSEKDLKEMVDNDWDNASEWNQKVYDNDINTINVNKENLEKANEGSYMTVVDYTNEKVCNKLIEFLDKEFAKTGCSKSRIDGMKADIDYFVKNNKTVTASDSRIATAYRKIKLYTDILSFGNKSFGLAPGFSMSSGSWNDIDSYCARQRRTRDSFRNAPDYKSLSHISDVNTALSSVDGKLKKAKSKFEEDLSRNIISAYSNAPRTPENENSLFKIYKKYYNSYSDKRRLSDFYKKFEKEVKAANRY